MITPLSYQADGGRTALDFEDRTALIEAARELADGEHPGVLTTVDGAGNPHARWMATIGMEDFPDLYTLTGPSSGKVEHIARNPNVEWMFTDEDRTLVLNLPGKAELVTDIPSIKRIWRSIRDKEHAYFLENFAEKPGFAVLKTEVRKVFCSVPRSNFWCQIELDALRALKPHANRG
jgi:general stress protein 26